MPHQERETLSKRMLNAGVWSIFGHGLSQIIRLGSSLIMTRLLVPEMFGVMAIATMVSIILTMLSDIGLRQNIVQSQRGDDPEFLDTAWVIQIVRGFILWLLALLLSMGLYFANIGGMIPEKSVYASAVLPFVIAITSLSSIISGFQSTKSAGADRRFEQKRLVQIELVSQLAALATMICIGLATRSIWALVAGSLVGSMVSMILSHTWMTGAANHFRWEHKALHELISFGKWIFISSAMTVFAATGDRLLLGGFVEADVMGLYAIAALIIRSVENGIQKLLSTVTLPAFSEIQRAQPLQLREIYLRLRVPNDLLLLFLTGFLYASGQELIDLLFDPRYSAAGGMFQVLALSLFSIRYGIAHQIYLAVGRTRYLAAINVLRCVSLYTLVPLLYYLSGTQGAIWGIALHATATIPLVYYFNAKLELNELRRELLVLPALPIGYILGTGMTFL